VKYRGSGSGCGREEVSGWVGSGGCCWGNKVGGGERYTQRSCIVRDGSGAKFEDIVEQYGVGGCVGNIRRGR